jgi:hypothetical protein
MPFRPDNVILARFSSSFAPYLFSALAGRHDDEDLICLTRRTVNNLPPPMKSERVVLGEKGGVSKRPVFENVMRAGHAG